MKAGKLDKRFVIETYTLSQDSFGAENPTWSTFCTVWGDFLPMPGSEQYAGDRKTEDVPYKIRLRYYSGINVKMRVNYDSTYYDIISINEIGRKEGYDLIVKLHRNY